MEGNDGIAGGLDGIDDIDMVISGVRPPPPQSLSERARTQRRDQKTGRFVAQRRSSSFADGFVLGAWSGLILGMGVFAALRVVCG